MDKMTIAQRAAQMKTRADLLLLLNDIRRDELTEAGRKEDYRPFTRQKFNFYINPNHTKGRYREFYIPKRSGGRRRISAPGTDTYKCMLHALNLLLSAVYSPSAHAMGFAPGRSIATGAEKHVGQHYVFNTDLRDFFPSIRRARVKARLLLPPFGFSEEVAIAIAGLCTLRVDVPAKDDGQPACTVYVLPQGAPTSPLLTNAVCDRLDRRLAGLARRCGAIYTRYADDITFSSPHNLYAEGSAFRTELSRIISVEGFEMNEAKTRVQRKGQRQEVTGLVVNSRVNVCRHYVRSLRSVLHIWRHYGYDVALAALLRHDRTVPEHRGRRRLPDLTRVLAGRLLFVRQVRGAADPLYARLQATFDELVASMSVRKYKDGLTFIWSVPLEQFEIRYGTKVVIHFLSTEPSPQPVLSDRVVGVAQSADTQTEQTAMASCRFTLPRNRAKGSGTYAAKVELPLTVSRRLTSQTPREGMNVSFCKGTKGIPFLLLHRQGAVTVATITGSNLTIGGRPAEKAPGIFASLPVYGKRRPTPSVQGEPPVDVDALLAELENYLTDHDG